jgi:hypothetical protein
MNAPSAERYAAPQAASARLVAGAGQAGWWEEVTPSAARRPAYVRRAAATRSYPSTRKTAIAAQFNLDTTDLYGVRCRQAGVRCVNIGRQQLAGTRGCVENDYRGRAFSGARRRVEDVVLPLSPSGVREWKPLSPRIFRSNQMRNSFAFEVRAAAAPRSSAKTPRKFFREVLILLAPAVGGGWRRDVGCHAWLKKERAMDTFDYTSLGRPDTDHLVPLRNGLAS